MYDYIRATRLYRVNIKKMYNITCLFSSQPPGQPMMPNSMDPTRQGERLFNMPALHYFFLALTKVAKGEWHRRMRTKKKSHSNKRISNILNWIGLL